LCAGLIPDKGEVGGSSPPKPTIKITSKYAAILTFPLSEDLPHKTDLPTIFQLLELPNTRGHRGFAAGNQSLKFKVDENLPTEYALIPSGPPHLAEPR
jgi:hypothetical protein